jgi:hypothetical protein
MKPITIYWAPYVSALKGEQLLYSKPSTLFADLMAKRSDEKDDKNYLACPAINKKFKNILTFKSPLTCSYTYNFDESEYLYPTTNASFELRNGRQPTLKDGPVYNFNFSYLLFADAPVDAYFTPPMFSKPTYTKEVSLIPGEFNIGQWFRPYNLEVQFWNRSGVIDFEKDETLFYVELKTDQKFVLKRFEISEKLDGYVRSNSTSFMTFGRGESLLDRYKRFRDVGMREMVLTEINKNLIQEDL